MTRALTLTQPWAGLVAAGIKLVENRPRAMIKRGDFGKRFAIHASREIDPVVYDRIRAIAPDLVPSFERDQGWWALSRITSAVIAFATLADALYIGGNDEATTRKMLDRAFGTGHTQERWTFGPTCYVLRDVVALAKPVPCRGYQGFWTLDEKTESAVREQL